MHPKRDRHGEACEYDVKDQNRADAKTFSKIPPKTLGRHRDRHNAGAMPVRHLPGNDPVRNKYPGGYQPLLPVGPMLPDGGVEEEGVWLASGRLPSRKRQAMPKRMPPKGCGWYAVW